MSSKQLVAHPEAARLADEIDLLREELARLLTEENDLLRIVRPNLLALYQQKLGVWELRGLNAQVALARARRRLEMAQAAINQGKTPNLTEIEGHLELEFLAWQQKIKEAAEQLEAAETRMGSLLSGPANLELRKLYYALVKKLHPDLNPKLSEDQHRLWPRVQTAYERGDVSELRALTLLVGTPGGDIPPQLASLDALHQDRLTLQNQITAMLRRIEHVEGQPPFTLRPQLADEAWLARRRQEIDSRIAACGEQRAALETHLATLLPGACDGKIFGNN